jgi:hypothetical protein
MPSGLQQLGDAMTVSLGIRRTADYATVCGVASTL